MTIKNPPEPRSKQRFAYFKKTLAQLSEFQQQTALNKFEVQGYIKSFEYTFELSWNVIKETVICG